MAWFLLIASNSTSATCFVSCLNVILSAVVLTLLKVMVLDVLPMSLETPSSFRGTHSFPFLYSSLYPSGTAYILSSAYKYILTFDSSRAFPKSIAYQSVDEVDPSVDQWLVISGKYQMRPSIA